MKVAILGAHGFLGQNLINELLKKTDYDIVALSLHASDIAITSSRLTAIDLDIFDESKLTTSLEGCDQLYYFVHMMAQHKRDFADAESDAARLIAKIVPKTNIHRIIYMGGLGNDNEKLSKHLASRHTTGALLTKAHVQVIEFRASLIVGKGSISYDIITNLVNKLPILTLPRWAKTLTQPIAKNDVLNYLIAASKLVNTGNVICEIGGPDVMTYEGLMRRYAHWKRTPAYFIHVPIIPANLAALWLNLFTPRTHAKVGKVLVDSLGNAMVVSNPIAKDLFPEIITQSIDLAFE